MSAIPLGATSLALVGMFMACAGLYVLRVRLEGDDDTSAVSPGLVALLAIVAAVSGPLVAMVMGYVAVAVVAACLALAAAAMQRRAMGRDLRGVLAALAFAAIGAVLIWPLSRWGAPGTVMAMAALIAGAVSLRRAARMPLAPS